MTEPHNPTQLDTSDTAPEDHPSFVDSGAEAPAAPETRASESEAAEAEESAEDATGSSGEAHPAPNPETTETESGEVFPAESEEKRPQTHRDDSAQAEAERPAADAAGEPAPAEADSAEASGVGGDASRAADTAKQDAEGVQAGAQTGSGRIPAGSGEHYPPESASHSPRIDGGDPTSTEQGASVSPEVGDLPAESGESASAEISEPATAEAGDSTTAEAGEAADAGDSASAEAGVLASETGQDVVLGDEDYLAPGQTEVPVGDEVVIDDETMRRALEAILMVTDEPLPVLTLARAVGRPTGDVSAALAALSEEYTEQGRGFDLREVGGGWRYYTRVEAAPYVERFVLDGQQARLTQAALETLAVVAYKQPVSRARVSAIRGVNVDGVMRTLVARGLVEEAGADTESHATLYRTTSYFLERMGMQSLEDLPELAPYLPEMDDIEEELAAQTISEVDAADQSPGEAPAAEAADTGIDGDLTTGEVPELDLEHQPGELEPADEVEPNAQGDRDG